MRAVHASTLPPAAAPPPQLSGDLAMWAIVGIEMLTFGLMFIVFAVARRLDPATFHAGQATLDVGQGAVNTALLLSGSWCAARGVLALRHDRPAAGARWLWAGAGGGALFVVSKLLEYQAKLAAGHDLESSTFWTLYYLLTGFHFLHVAAATLLLAAIAWLVPRRGWGRADTHAPETVAIFWHMVDLLWIVLFPLVYVLR